MKINTSPLLMGPYLPHLFLCLAAFITDLPLSSADVPVICPQVLSPQLHSQSNGVDDPYVVLSVSNTSSLEEIRKAYISLVKMHHQAQLGNGPVPKFSLQEINDAYREIRLSANDDPLHHRISSVTDSQMKLPGIVTKTPVNPYKVRQDQLNDEIRFPKGTRLNITIDPVR